MASYILGCFAFIVDAFKAQGLAQSAARSRFVASRLLQAASLTSLLQLALSHNKAGEGTTYHGRNEVPRLLRAGRRGTVLLIRRQQVLNGQQTIVAFRHLNSRLLKRALAHCASFSNVSRLLAIVDVVFSDRLWGAERFPAN